MHGFGEVNGAWFVRTNGVRINCRNVKKPDLSGVEKREAEIHNWSIYEQILILSEHLNNIKEKEFENSMKKSSEDL